MLKINQNYLSWWYNIQKLNFYQKLYSIFKIFHLAVQPSSVEIYFRMGENCCANSNMLLWKTIMKLISRKTVKSSTILYSLFIITSCLNVWTKYDCFESFPFRQHFVIFVRQITWFRWNVRHWTSIVNVYNKNSNQYVPF